MLGKRKREMPTSLSLDCYKRAVSEFFDARSNYSRSELHFRMAEHLVRLAAPQTGEQVLDIATGTGFVSIPAARLVGVSGNVVGVDISAGMLKQAAEAVMTEGLNNIDLVQADAETFNYPEASFDLITCCNALPYMSDIPSALRHWYMLLRPGGRLLFNCWDEDSYATGKLLRSIANAHGIRVALIGQDTGTPERCRAILAKAGFERQEVHLEPTATFFTVDRLGDLFESVLKSPLFGISQSDRSRVNDLRDEYMAEARTSSVRESINAEVGAYFVMAYKSPILSPQW